MAPGLRVAIEITAPSSCPLTAVASSANDDIRRVTWTGSGTETVEEFRLPTDADDPETVDRADPVFDLGDERVYQFERTDEGCPCDTVEQLGYPIADVAVENDAVVLTLYLSDLEALREIVEGLQDAGDRVSVRYLVHERTDDEPERPTVVDQGRLTDRQRETVERAYRMGYFEYPREATATDVAEAMDIDSSTFAEHLATAQSKLLTEVLEG